jgi:DNA-binding transcriptional LysR family regulator
MVSWILERPLQPCGVPWFTLAPMNLMDAYRYLAALGRHRHFGRAADACHITQPALSNALRALESHLGVSIVRRARQFEGFTPEGQAVLASAHRILREQETLVQDLVSSSGQPRGRLVIGTVPTALPIATRFASWLVRQHPGIAPQLRSMSSQDIESGLEDLSLDLGLGFEERVQGRASLQLLPQYEEHHHLLWRAAEPASAQSCLPVGPALTWAEAVRQPLCLLTPEMHHRALLEKVFASLGLQVRPVLETDSVLALVVAVQAGPVAAVMPGALAATVAPQSGLRVSPLTQPDLRTPIVLMSSTRARPSRALEAALALAAQPDWLQEVRAHSGALASMPCAIP